MYYPYSDIHRLKDSTIKNTELFHFGYEKFFYFIGHGKNRKLHNYWVKYGYCLIVEILKLYDDEKYKYYGSNKKKLSRKTKIQFKLYTKKYNRNEFIPIKDSRKNRIQININEINDYNYFIPYNMDKLDFKSIQRTIKIKRIINNIK